MANAILTPLALWRDFDDKQPLEETILSEEREDGICYTHLNFSGRQTAKGRVRIYGVFAAPETGESFPALLILPDGGKGLDKRLMARFVRRGYAVLMVDYSGSSPEGMHTVYPEDVAYANFNAMGRHFAYVDTDATETCWYEWTAVGRYAISYLKSRPDVKKLGVMGIRIGGEIAWKLMLSEDVCCGIPVCAAGWLAYRGVHKFGRDAEKELMMDYERHRFMAGVDSQAYAPFVHCPVLMLCSTNDDRFDYDRAYDTYSRINPEVECVISYSINSNSCIGGSGIRDMDLFLDKQLKGRQVFIPRPANIVLDIDDSGRLVAHITLDKCGEMKRCRVFVAEDCMTSSQRDWTEMREVKSSTEQEIVFYLNVYEKAKTVFAFAVLEYSSGFTVSSKIAVFYAEKPFAYGVPKSKIMYQNGDGVACFAVADISKFALAECFLEGEDVKPQLLEGYKGIRGVSSPYGLKTYRVGNPRYTPEPDALLCFDICSREGGEVKVTFASLEEGQPKPVLYRTELYLSGANGWKNIVLKAKNFKQENGTPLRDFSRCVSMSMTSELSFIVNNILWI